MTDFEKMVQLIQSFGFVESKDTSSNYYLKEKEYYIAERHGLKTIEFGDGGENSLGYSSFCHSFGFDMETGKYRAHGAAE